MAQEDKFVNVNMHGQDIRELSAIYFGVPDADGSWRIYLSGTTLLIEVHTGGSYQSRGSFNP